MVETESTIRAMPATKSENRRTNPIVDRYVTTDLPVLDFARSVPSGGPLLDALVRIHECLQGKRLAKDAIAAAHAVPVKGSDPELLILMLGAWAELSSRIGRPSETEALVQQARTLLGPATHPAVRAYALFVEGVLADTTGNKARCEETIREILDLLPEHSPRRKLYLWEHVLFLARQGRGIECGDELRELTWQCNERYPVGRVLLAQFVNAVETGSSREASALLPQLATGVAQLRRELTRIPYSGYKALLQLMHGSMGETEPRPGAGPDARAARPVWIAVTRSLLDGKPGPALKLARVQADKVMGSIFGSGFDAFSLVRAELSAGNAGAARHLLQMRAGRGNRHYLDDFFLARAERLEGNPKKAADRFAGVLRAVDTYRASGRLDFELSLACEMSHGDIVNLSRAAARGGTGRRPSAGRRPGKPAAKHDPAAAAAQPGAAGHAAAGVIVGRSDAVRRMREAIARFAETDAPVLITGETGTGKELVARALHSASSRRRGAFTAVNCSSMTETLLESELFGYERGAFTGAEKTTQGLFEATGKGAIFLDEIGDISPRLQTALLRVLETGEIRPVGSTKPRRVHCRILAATNADLAARAAGGTFREDLMYRLQRLVIAVPPLRERTDDIPLLVRHFLDAGRPVGVHARVSGRVLAAMRTYTWPGNIRELRNVVERMRLMHSDKLSYDVDDLEIKLQPAPHPAPRSAAAAQPTAAEPAGETTHSRPGIEDVGAYLRAGRSQLRRLDRLRALFRDHGKLTRGEIIRILGVSPNTATKDLKALCADGVIRRVEPSASTRSHYFEAAGSA